jgi:hypothetical protein
VRPLLLLIQQLEHGYTVILAGDSLPIDQAGLHLERFHRLHNWWMMSLAVPT